jgi:hypothetical protein
VLNAQAAGDVIAIGDSKEEEEAAKACNIKFVKVQGPQVLSLLALLVQKYRY